MQSLFPVPFPALAPKLCVVCAEPLGRHIALTPRGVADSAAAELHPLCSEPACRAVFARARAMPDSAFERHLRWSAQAMRDQTRRSRLVNRRWKTERRQADAAFAVLESRRGHGAPSDLQLVAPSGRAPSRALPQRRRRAYAAHLDAIIAAALDGSERAAAPATKPDIGPPAHPLFGRLCGFCGGGCCGQGGNQAYLTAQTVARTLAADPALDPERLRAAYLAHLAPRTVSGSCINHTALGCALPRSLRSDTCNTYACHVLKSLRKGVEADPPVRKLVVLQRRQNLWNQDDLALDNRIVAAAVLVEGTTTRRRPPASAMTTDDAADRAP